MRARSHSGNGNASAMEAVIHLVKVSGRAGSSHTMRPFVDDTHSLTER